MKTPHVHAECIKAWADGAEIEVKLKDGEWEQCNQPFWCGIHEYRIKPKPVITKRYFHVDNFEEKLNNDEYQVVGILRQDNYRMHTHIELTFTDGKVTAVELKNK